MKKFAILVAGGKGSRMLSETPKQFLPLQGVPIIAHTVQKFLDFDQDIGLVVVLPAVHLDIGKEILGQHFVSQSIKYCVGGDTRFQSVRNGLAIIEDDGLVAIHDAVRPLVTPEEISQTFQLASEKGSGILVTEVKESLRRIEGQFSVAVPRGQYRTVQTPQTFSIKLLKAAYRQPEDQSVFTDDASVYERAGHKVHMVVGSYRNIKITTPEDLSVAEVLLA